MYRASGRGNGWPQAAAYEDGDPQPQTMPAARRFGALAWSALSLGVSVCVAGAAYVAILTVLVPGARFDPRAWVLAVGARGLVVIALAACATALLHVGDRAVFGWAHAPDAAPEPRKLLAARLALLVGGLLLATIESIAVHVI